MRNELLGKVFCERVSVRQLLKQQIVNLMQILAVLKKLSNLNDLLIVQVALIKFLVNVSSITIRVESRDVNKRFQVFYSKNQIDDFLCSKNVYVNCVAEDFIEFHRSSNVENDLRDFLKLINCFLIFNLLTSTSLNIFSISSGSMLKSCVL